MRHHSRNSNALEGLATASAETLKDLNNWLGESPSCTNLTKGFESSRCSSESTTTHEVKSKVGSNKGHHSKSSNNVRVPPKKRMKEFLGESKTCSSTKGTGQSDAILEGNPEIQDMKLQNPAKIKKVRQKKDVGKTLDNKDPSGALLGPNAGGSRSTFAKNHKNNGKSFLKMIKGVMQGKRRAKVGSASKL